jgi:hypothetical protein
MRPEEIVNDFWRRFTEGRWAIGGTVRFYDYSEEQWLGDWKPRVREEMGDFLREYKPDFNEFAHLALLRRDRWGDEGHLRWVLKWQAASAFADWLKNHGVPEDVAGKAAHVYEFDFEVRRAK